MQIIIDTTNQSLESFYEDTMAYLFDKYHRQAPDDFDMSLQMEQELAFAESFQEQEAKGDTRRSRVF